MNFNSDLKAGTNAEHIFHHFEGHLSKRNVLCPQITAQEHISGKDRTGMILGDDGIRTENSEIKAILSNHFISRNNNSKSSPDPSGTLEFELWSNAWFDDGSSKDRKYWTDGWFKKMLHPERYNTDNSVTVVKPSRLVYMLCADREGRKPYACVNFENYGELEERLRQIAPFNLDDIPSPTERMWRDEALNVPVNCWYVSFDKVKDLATITQILDNQIVVNSMYSFQAARYRNLSNSFNNPALNMHEERARLVSAAKAHKNALGLPDDAPLPHMTFFSSEKLPAYVCPGDNAELSEIINE